MSKSVSFSMFFLSFAPLWASIIVIDLKSIYEGGNCKYTEIIGIICISIVMMVSLNILRTEFKRKKKKSDQTYILVSAKENKTLTSEFLLGYMLPLFTFDFTVWHQVVLFLIFFVVFLFLCLRHNYFSVNIILELMQYRFYECELENRDHVVIQKTVISLDTLTSKKKKMLLLRAINNEYYLQIEQKESGCMNVIDNT